MRPNEWFTEQEARNMRNILTRDRDHAASFFQEHHAVLASIASTSGTALHLTPEARTLIAKARAHFGYSPTTIDHDILRALTRHFRSHQENHPPDKA